MIVIGNDSSRLTPVGTDITMAIDSTDNQVEATVTALYFDQDVEYYQIQVQGCDANVTFDGSNPASATPFKVVDTFTQVYNRATLRATRWSKQTGEPDGTLVIQGLEL